MHEKCTFILFSDAVRHRAWDMGSDNSGLENDLTSLLFLRGNVREASAQRVSLCLLAGTPCIFSKEKVIIPGRMGLRLLNALKYFSASKHRVHEKRSEMVCYYPRQSIATQKTSLIVMAWTSLRIAMSISWPVFCFTGDGAMITI